MNNEEIEKDAKGKIPPKKDLPWCSTMAKERAELEFKRKERILDLFCSTALKILANRDWSINRFTRDELRVIIEEYAHAAYGFYLDTLEEVTESRIEEKFSDTEVREFLFARMTNLADPWDYFEHLPPTQQKKWIRYGASFGWMPRTTDWHPHAQIVNELEDDIDGYLDGLMQRSENVYEAVRQEELEWHEEFIREHPETADVLGISKKKKLHLHLLT